MMQSKGARASGRDTPALDGWDVVVIGTGMGGSTLGHALARQGRSVLFLERGPARQSAEEPTAGGVANPEATSLVAPSRKERLMRGGQWPEPLRQELHAREPRTFAHPLGVGGGGSSSRFGMVMDRFFPEDFESWPVTYDELAPWYEKAEALYRVRGSEDPMRPGVSFQLMPPPAPVGKEQALLEGFQALGLHPYRIHYACERLPGCDTCVGSLCLRECRNDAGRMCLRPALRSHGARIIDWCEVLSLEEENGAVTAAVCRREGETQPFKVRGRVFVLAAGAFMTPVLLQRSVSSRHPNGLANNRDLVGRNLMLHCSDHYLVTARRSLESFDMAHGVSVNDFYRHAQGKLGNFHAHPFTIDEEKVLSWLQGGHSLPAWLRVLSPLFPLVANLGARLYRARTVFASVLEDLPYAENRVVGTSEDGSVRYQYRVHDELRRRVDLSRRLFLRTLAPKFKVKLISNPRDVALNLGHVCGTCRFGTSPETSVLDPSNRAHEVDNLYVVDASFFPSSGGINPSLTIAANALRVADTVHTRL
ncbi:GMC family oxidoreductase [Pyxidicoccus fallax]|uniref:GMC family oxidoreductase n=1 Tax=Pyxidicoccus fallax TaxID=394095 RepID=A0A848LLX6_9BACT|nr:GMC family oxidoreductase [Pyxidicoccus fallax]NMO18682.1 GMC family oxidoreductase [Pyxidicoccus fallax]NPC79133.1 GMC family oxidoreductase [Pyxidicoccus fallax]